MAEPTTTEQQKVITLETLGTVVDKIKEDFPTREEVTKEIEESGGANLEYATREEVLALFDDPADASGGEDGGDAGGDTAGE